MCAVTASPEGFPEPSSDETVHVVLPRQSMQALHGSQEEFLGSLQALHGCQEEFPGLMQALHG